MLIFWCFAHSMFSFFRVIRFAAQHFWRNIWLSLITVSMLILTLFTVNVLLILQRVTESAIASVEEKIDISLYFQPETPEKKIQNAAGYLRGLEQVRDVEIITEEEVLKKFQQEHAKDQVILSSLDEIGGNPFGTTLVVKMYSAEDFDFLLEALNNPQFADDIQEKDFSNYTDIIDRMKKTTEKIKWVGIGLSLLFLGISLLIIFNTVRMNVMMYREEIGIMKLVGATDWFVRGPFFFEAFYYSFLSVAITSMCVLIILNFFEPQLNNYFSGGEMNLFSYFFENIVWIFGLQFLCIFCISLLSTGFAMRKYLRV